MPYNVPYANPSHPLFHCHIFLTDNSLDDGLYIQAANANAALVAARELFASKYKLQIAPINGSQHIRTDKNGIAWVNLHMAGGALDTHGNGVPGGRSISARQICLHVA